MISEEDYLARQLWLFEELMVLPVRRESKLSGEYVVLNASDCPSLHGLREMLRAIRRAEAYSRREQERYRTFVSDTLARFPLATSVESPDRTVVYFYDADGSVCASRRLSTVGNF